MGIARVGPRARCDTLLRLLEIGIERVAIVDEAGRLHGHVDAVVARDLPPELLGSPLAILCERAR